MLCGDLMLLWVVDMDFSVLCVVVDVVMVIVCVGYYGYVDLDDVVMEVVMVWFWEWYGVVDVNVNVL